MSNVRERYSPVLVGVNETLPITSNAVGCFLCTVSGTLTITANGDSGKAAYTLLSALTVTAGTYYKLPFYLSSNGGTVTTAGGAAGILGV